MTEYDGHGFHNRTLDLDGNVYRGCHFINCQFRFRGHERFVFEWNRYEGAFWLHLLDSWRTMPDALDPIRTELRRYGVDLDEALTPREAAPSRQGQWAPYLEERELHIEYWFQREGKPGGGLTQVNPCKR